MLQKADIQRHEWLKSQVERLGIRFPVAEIAEKTGWDQGNISSYLKGKKPISDKFFTKFREVYKVEDSLANPGEPSTKEILLVLAEAFKSQTTILDRIESKMAQEKTQAKIHEKVTDIESNLDRVLRDQEGGIALIGEILLRDIRQEAAGNLDKEKEILDDLLQRIGPRINSDVKKGISADGGS